MSPPCYLHPKLPASAILSVPCAPGGKIHVCALCNADPDIAAKVWEKYKVAHSERITLFKTAGNPQN